MLVYSTSPASNAKLSSASKPDKLVVRHSLSPTNDHFGYSSTLKFGFIEPNKVSERYEVLEKFYPDPRVINGNNWTRAVTIEPLKNWFDPLIPLLKAEPLLETKRARTKQQEQLIYIFMNLIIALHMDPLTEGKVWNRKFFDKQLEAHVAQSNASTRHPSVCLAIIDLNDFKAINEACGHDFGDKAIIKFAQVLRDVTPKNAYACRIGGDEFAIIFPNGTKPDTSRDVFNSLKNKLEMDNEYGEDNRVKDGNLAVYLSCSYAYSSHPSTSATTVYSDADLELRKPKLKKSQSIEEGFRDIRGGFKEFEEAKSITDKENAKVIIRQGLQKKRSSFNADPEEANRAH